MHFRNRTDAGAQLAGRLAAYAFRPDVTILALPRGGVPVAVPIAATLHAPLDVLLVRKLGVPGHAELAMGAVAAGRVAVLSRNLIDSLGIPETVVTQTIARERLELDRRDRMFRSGRPAPPVTGRTVILVDDGLATGSTMEAAVLALRDLHPSRIVVAIPVGAAESCARLQRVADAVVCLFTPRDFGAVGQWYDDFSQTTDEEVIRLLQQAGEQPPVPARG